MEFPLYWDDFSSGQGRNHVELGAIGGPCQSSLEDGEAA